jgi:CheY-like chemotaxis protein
MMRLAIERMLAHLGYRSLVAASGEEALVIYEQSGADIAAVILDITMPAWVGSKPSAGCGSSTAGSR